MARPTAAQRGYGRRWRELRERFLALPENQYCACGCGQRATVVDHRKAHRGDSALFWSKANWQALAKPCHDAMKQQVERRGYSNRLGPDGYPTDPNHPANREVPA